MTRHKYCFNKYKLMNEPIPKKSHLRRNIAIATIMILLFLIIGFIAYNFYYSHRLHTFTENDAINIPPSHINISKLMFLRVLQIFP
jgi:hypothetical protein